MINRVENNVKQAFMRKMSLIKVSNGISTKKKHDHMKESANMIKNTRIYKEASKICCFIKKYIKFDTIGLYGVSFGRFINVVKDIHYCQRTQHRSAILTYELWFFALFPFVWTSVTILMLDQKHFANKY